MARNKDVSQFAVIGLGRFGLSIVQTLAEYDVNILACDKDANRLQNASSFAAHLVQIDVSDESALTKLGLGNFDVVILAMGEDFESSQIAAMVAKEQGAKYVMVKARSSRQKRILENMGVDRVVLPEYEMGAKIARSLVGSNILDVLEESEHYTITEMQPLEDWIGKSVREADIRRKHDLSVLGIRRNDKLTIPAPPDRKIAIGDVLIVLSEHKPPTAPQKRQD